MTAASREELQRASTCVWIEQTGGQGQAAPERRGARGGGGGGGGARWEAAAAVRRAGSLGRLASAPPAAVQARLPSRLPPASSSVLRRWQLARFFSRRVPAHPGGGSSPCPPVLRAGRLPGGDPRVLVSKMTSTGLGLLATALDLPNQLLQTDPPGKLQPHLALSPSEASTGFWARASFVTSQPAAASEGHC